MLFKNITILDEDFQIRENQYVAIQHERIAYIGDTRPEGDYGEEYHGRGKLLMPGFYNAHAHSPMTLMRGYGENVSLQDWLAKKIFPFEAKLDTEAVYWGTMLAMAESFKFGIVSTSDMYYFCDAMADAVIDSGAKANISRAIANPRGEDPQTLESMKEMKALYGQYHNAAEGKVMIDMSLHAEYTSDYPTAVALAEYAKTIDAVMAVHVSETQLEHEECIERHGLTPAAYFAKAGLFDVPAVAAHCVYCTGEDLDIFKEKKVTVATNPVSNMKLASGICNVKKIADKGINVAIGTDSVASNNSLNFVEEMKVLAIGNKVSIKEPEAISPKQVLYFATRGGAIAQGREDCGLVKEGNRADLIVMDISGPNMHPVHNLVNNIVYSGSGSDIVLTMIDGKVVYRDRNYCTINIEKVIDMSQQEMTGILERLK
ncbi:MAG: amidohydrolase [Clostridiales bacterium]|nr:amidohydrolase [Clostridiales bacterium]